MLTVTLTRLINVEYGIISRFTAPGLGKTIWAVERAWNGNHTGNSCIPEGTYPLRPHSGPRFPAAWEVCDVPGRTAILIHPANQPGELAGCIAPCLQFKLLPTTKPSSFKVFGESSRVATKAIYDLIQRAHDSGGAQLLVNTHRAALNAKEPQA
jgi:hypothetical protein